MKFKLIATSQIILHFSLISIQIILGYLKYNTAIHLIIGFMGGYMFSLLYLGIKNKALLKTNFYINFSLKILKKHMHYIIYSVFPALLDQIRLATPIFLLNKYFSSDAGGLFFLSLKILNFPLTLFGNAFSKVILQKYSHNFNKHHSINEITKEFFPIVLTCGFVSYLSILILGKNFFLIILGENWVNIIPIISILCLGVCAEFFALPFLNIFSVVKQQNILGIWKASFLIVMILGLYLSLKTSMLTVFLWVYSLINTVLYIISFLLNIKTVKLVDFKND